MKLRNRLPFFLRLLNKIRTLFGIPPLTLTNAKAGNLMGLTAYGGLEQNGTPAPDNFIPLVCNNGEIKVDSGGNIYTDGLTETLRIVESNSTATTEMLLKSGDYVDSQDILQGIVNRQLGIKVFDGSESFNGTAISNCYSWISSDILFGNFEDRKLFSTHFSIWTESSLPPAANREGYAFRTGITQIGSISFGAKAQYSSITLFQDFLSQQYNNGTPLIAIFPLATPTETSVTAQSMSVVEGNNTLEIQQSSLNNLEIEVTYKEK